MKRGRWIEAGILFLGFLFCLVLFSYYLPSTAKVQVTGTEVKWTDDSDPKKPRRDIRYVQGRDVESGETRVFRNEDTGWGWPPYMKFDSTELSGLAANLAKDDKKIALATYYGWQITLFDSYPNLIELEEVPADYRHIPITNIIFLVFFFGGFGVLYFYSRKQVVKLWQRFFGKKAATQV